MAPPRFASDGASSVHFDWASFSRLHSQLMKFLRWIWARLSLQRRKAESLNGVPASSGGACSYAIGGIRQGSRSTLAGDWVQKQYQRARNDWLCSHGLSLYMASHGAVCGWNCVLLRVPQPLSP